MGLLGDSFTLYKRELLIFKSNLRVNIIRSVVFPLVLIVLLGNIGNSISGIPMAAVNYANNPSSISFLNSLQRNNQVVLKSVTNQQTAMSMLNTGKVDVVIVILPSFPSSNGGAPTIYVYYSDSQLSVSSMIIALVQSVASKYGATVSSGGAYALQQQNAYAAPTSQFTSVTNVNGTYKDFLFSGILVMVVVFGTFFSGGLSMIADRQLGNIKLLLVSPIHKDAIVLSRLLSGATQSVLYVSIAIVIGVMDGVTMAMGAMALVWAFIVAAIVAFAFTGVSIAIASRISKGDAYMIIAQAINLPLWFLAGGFFPTSSLPSWLYPLSVVNPLTYATDILRDAVLAGSFQGTLLTNFAILFAFAIFGVGVGFRFFKSTIE